MANQIALTAPQLGLESLDTLVKSGLFGGIYTTYTSSDRFEDYANELEVSLIRWPGSPTIRRNRHCTSIQYRFIPAWRQIRYRSMYHALRVRCSCSPPKAGSSASARSRVRPLGNWWVNLPAPISSPGVRGMGPSGHAPRDSLFCHEVLL